MSAEHVIIMSTTDSEESALALASGAVEAGLGACAQIVGPITSVFRWDGAVQTEREWRVEVKTAGDRAQALIEHLEANHGYDVPEVVTVPVTGGSVAYLSWVADETR
ncbi:divalent-cation tolerance protein CutA [Haloactinopolyspora alba]|nr:divalent-cation tolerance protein CutA [Haloactinopolyspora alba]